ncbi:MAG TPA: SulP family inorganic anion transporter [Planctomycetaceae bacterium]
MKRNAMPTVDPPARPAAVPSDGPLWKSILGHDFAASIVVFLVALPLCMGIAQASGVPVAAGLITGIVGGLIVAPLAGAPLQVSGPAAGLTVIVYDLVLKHGLPALGVIVLIAGGLQFAAGLFRLGQWFRAVSPAVIRGMLSGIGVLILASQFHLMVDDEPRKGGIQNLLAIPEAIWKGFRIPEPAPAEVRGVRTAFLHRFGDLHEKQEEIRELVDESVSDAPSPEEAEIEKAKLRPLVARQAAVLEGLRSLADEARESPLATNGTNGGARLAEALDRALATNEAAFAALEARDLETVRERQAEAAVALAEVNSSLKKHEWAALLGLLTIGTIIVWQSLTPKAWRLIPGPLVAVVLTTALAFLFSLPVLYVEVPDNLLDGVHFPSMIALQDVPWQGLLTGGLVIAAVASAETLLCATAVDQMHTGPRTRYDRELAAQGVGNMVCGLLGALPMTGVIVRSSTNVMAGARTRWSAFMHGLWLLLFVAGLGTLLRYIPTSVLAGILVYTGYKLIDVKALKDLRAFGRSEVGIYLATVAGIVVFDLLTGVILGIALSGLKLLLTFSRLKARLKDGPGPGEATLELVGAATFVRLPKLAAALERVAPGVTLHMDLGRLTYLDHACMELISSWSRQHQSTGGEVVIDWDALHADVRHFVQPARHFRESIEAVRSNAPERTEGPAVKTAERLAS